MAEETAETREEKPGRFQRFKKWWNEPVGKKPSPELPESKEDLEDQLQEPEPAEGEGEEEEPAKKGYFARLRDWANEPVGRKKPEPPPVYERPKSLTEFTKEVEGEGAKVDEIIVEGDKAGEELLAAARRPKPTPAPAGDVITYLRSVGLDAAAEGPDEYKRGVKTIFDDEKITVFDGGSGRHLVLDAEKKEVYTVQRRLSDHKYHLVAVYSAEGIAKLIDYDPKKPADKGHVIRMLYNTGDFHGTARSGNILDQYYPDVEKSPEYPARQKRLEEIVQKILPEFLPPAEPKAAAPPAAPPAPKK